MGTVRARPQSLASKVQIAVRSAVVGWVKISSEDEERGSSKGGD